MQFNGVNNQEHKFHLCGQRFVKYEHVPGFLVLLLLRALQWFVGVLSQHFLSISVSPERGDSLEAVSLPLSLPFLPLFYQCDGCLFSPFHVGAHGWVAWICQPWEWSPSRSWLPIVEAPGCVRHPTSTLRGSC